METMRVRARSAVVSASRLNGGGAAPAGHEELKSLVEEYKGFGIICLIRALMFKNCRSTLLAFVGVVLLVGQWAGPVGFIAFKLENENVTACDGNGGIWARFVMGSVAMIYFARLSLAAVSHRQKRPASFDAYKMPKWWRALRPIDLIITSLLYDTMILLANLFIVFQDRDINDMVVDVLALEFFTIIDDEFKVAVIAYDSTFLDSMVMVEPPSEMLGPHRGFDVEEAFSVEGPQTCCDTMGEIALAPVKAVLHIIRAVCRLAGPLGALVMIAYGPYCIGLPQRS